MKKIIIIAAAALLSASATLSAQNASEAFFLNGYRLGYRYNPAVQNEGDFVSAGEFSSQSRANVGAASFLYPRDGEVVTALHESVSADEFLSGLSDLSYISSGLNLNLVSYGFRKGEVYHTLEANVRALYGVTVPKEIFSLVKLGGESSYDLSNLCGYGNAYAEIAYGNSRRISDKVSIGARAKLLIGIASMRYNVSRFNLEMSESQYTADITTELDMTNHFHKFATDENGYISLLNSDLKGKWPLPSGAGLAVDLGAVVTPVEGLTISASVLDLGGMLWHYGNKGRSNGRTVFTGVNDLTIDQIKNGEIKQQLQPVLDDLLSSVYLSSLEAANSIEMLPFSANAGVKYALPFYDAVSLGLTGTYTHQTGMSHYDGRFGASWEHPSGFGVTGNFGLDTFGTVYGLALKVRFHHFNFFAAYEDGTSAKVPYKNWHLNPNRRSCSFGITYDI